MSSKEQVKTFLEYFVEEECNGIDELLDQHAKNKADLINFLGSEKVEIPFKYVVTGHDVRVARHAFHEEYDNVLPGIVRSLLDYAPVEDIIANRCLGYGFEEPILATTPNFKPGMKLSKVLSNLIHDVVNYSEINGRPISKREWFDIEYSKLCQSLKGDGFLTLSVDPIDFLTMSYNKSNWHSCHKPKGDHRAGCLSYMCDYTSLVAYFHNGKEYNYFDGFNYNSKQWRQMVFIDLKNYGAILSRQYPYMNITFSKAVRDFVGTRFSEVFKIPRTWTIHSESEIISEEIQVPNELAYCDPYRGHNDAVHMNMFDPAAIIFDGEYDGKITSKTLSILVGSNPICPVCGSDVITKEDELKCENCGGETCCCCGERIREDNTYFHDGSIYCSDCFHEHFGSCEHCGDLISLDEATYVEDYGHVCQECIGSSCFSSCYDCGKIITDEYATTTADGRYICSECCRRNYSMCGCCKNYERDEELDADGLCHNCHENAQERVGA